MTNATKARTYYIIATNEDGAGWGCQFGDYDRDCVEQEIEDSYGDIPKRYVKLLRIATDDQPAIDAAIAKLNA